MFNDRSFAGLGNLPCKVTVRRSSFFSSSSFSAEKSRRNVLKKFPPRKIKDRGRGLPGKINLLLFKFHLDEVPFLPR